MRWIQTERMLAFSEKAGCLKWIGAVRNNIYDLILSYFGLAFHRLLRPKRVLTFSPSLTLEFGIFSIAEISILNSTITRKIKRPKSKTGETIFKSVMATVMARARINLPENIWISNFDRKIQVKYRIYKLPKRETIRFWRDLLISYKELRNLSWLKWNKNYKN